MRGVLLKLPESPFVDVMKLLATEDHCAPEVLHELARTPAIRRRMKEVGFIPPSEDEKKRRRRTRPTRSREVLKKCGIELPKVKRPLPRCIWIGRERPGTREVRMDRAELFERVWETPVSKLAGEWGLSGRGLKKNCERLKIPTPPRGYWPKKRAGKRVRRPKLPSLPEGEGEKVVVWEVE